MSQTRPKSRRREWTLSPRDLPDPRVIKDEPLLQDLENNATYRMLVYRRKAASAGTDPALLGCLILVTLPLLFSGQMWLVVTTVVVLLVVLVWASRGSENNPAQNFLFGVDRERFKDLLSAGVSRADMSVALWGYFLPSGNRLWLYQCTPMIMAIPILASILLINDPTRWAFTPFLTWAAAETAKRQYLPYTRLPYVAKVGDLARSAGCSVGIWSMGLLMLGSIFLVMAAVGNLHFHKNSIHPVISTVIFGPYAPTISAIVLGLIIGTFLGRGSRNGRDQWLSQTRKWLRNLSDEIARADEEV